MPEPLLHFYVLSACLVPVFALQIYLLRHYLRVTMLVMAACFCLLLGVEVICFTILDVPLLVELLRVAPQYKALYLLFMCAYFMLAVMQERVPWLYQLYLFFPLAIQNITVIEISFMGAQWMRGQWGTPLTGGFVAVILLLYLVLVPLSVRQARTFKGFFDFDLSAWNWGWVPCLAILCFDLLCIFSPDLDQGRLLFNVLLNYFVLQLYFRFIAWFFRDQHDCQILRQKLLLTEELAGRESELISLGPRLAQGDRIIREHLGEFIDRLERDIEARDAPAIAKALESEQVEIMGSLDSEFHSEHELLNSILTYERSRAMAKGVNPMIKVKVPRDLGIRDLDLATMLGNLFDNAFEACEKLPANQRWLTFNAERVGSMLAVVIDNSCDSGAIRCVDGTYLSQKQDRLNHGIGLASVREIVAAYQGTIKIEHGQNQFRVSILMGMRPSNG
ncbi:MAG: ATP-binding protein [Succinivibrionaceae bacterium]|nr:ATP-binding protein [Succinivibrionaceae bacterium]